MEGLTPAVAVKPLWAIADELRWSVVVELEPDHRNVVPQYAVPVGGGWAMTQGRDNGTGNNAWDDLILSRFGAGGGRALETRIVPRGGHGDRVYVVGGHLVTLVEGVWARVRFGSPWSWRGTATPARCPRKAGPGCQGEAQLPDGRWLQLYGESMKGGAERDPSHRPAFLQLIAGGDVVSTLDLDGVARDADGEPLGGRYEPEGVFVAELDGVLYVLVGFSVGRLGATSMVVFGCPVERVAP